MHCFILCTLHMQGADNTGGETSLLLWPPVEKTDMNPNYEL